jgi:hypothetical protein
MGEQQPGVRRRDPDCRCSAGVHPEACDCAACLPGRMSDLPDIVDRLERGVPRESALALLSDPRSVIRESALLALWEQRDDEVRAAVAVIARNDPSPGVRMVARDMLDEDM